MFTLRKSIGGSGSLPLILESPYRGDGNMRGGETSEGGASIIVVYFSLQMFVMSRKSVTFATNIMNGRR
jgi:hypothetical protein